MGLAGYQYKGKVAFVEQAASGVQLDLKRHDDFRPSQKAAPAGIQHATLLVTRDGHLYHKRYGERQWAHCLSWRTHAFSHPPHPPEGGGAHMPIPALLDAACTCIPAIALPRVSFPSPVGPAVVSAVSPVPTQPVSKFHLVTFSDSNFRQTGQRACCAARGILEFA